MIDRRTPPIEEARRPHVADGCHTRRPWGQPPGARGSEDHALFVVDMVRREYVWSYERYVGHPALDPWGTCGDWTAEDEHDRDWFVYGSIMQGGRPLP